jgi:oxygen-independent coproporphyrinogen-3 oxidase
MSSVINNLYIHVPFCDGKCDYCAFYSAPFATLLADRFLDCLAIEMDLWLEDNPAVVPRTIYIGGGTPTVLTNEQIKRLLEIIKSHIDVSQVVEWTIEMNPGNFDYSLPDVLRDAGITRVSLGAQILDDDVLKAIGRRHTVSDIFDAVSLLKSAGITNYNIDLISSLPEVSELLWIDSINQVVDLEPAHIALYNFSVEQGTVMEKRYNHGVLSVASDNIQLQLLNKAGAILDCAGYGRYEISNYSLPGFESKHNLACWYGDDYVGFGPAASSRVGVMRRTNNADIDSYIDALSKKKLPPSIEEMVTVDIDVLERFMFGFRLVTGVDLMEFTGKYHPAPEQLSYWKDILVRLVAEGFLLQNKARYYPTARGLDSADYIAGEFIGESGR